MLDRPQHLVQSARRQNDRDPRPYDALKRAGVIGFVRDNFVCEVEDVNGQNTEKRLPATVSYFQNGDNGQWEKDFFGYTEGVVRSSLAERTKSMAVYDPVSELSFMTMPYDNKTEVFAAKENFKRVASDENFDFLFELSQRFEGVEFGLFGSRALDEDISRPNSDMDIVVYGIAAYRKIVSSLEDPVFCAEIGLLLQTEDKIESDTAHYMRKYKLSEKEARLMAMRRRRYRLSSGIKVSVNCAISGDDFSQNTPPMLVGSKKVEEMTTEGKVINCCCSSSLPRVFRTKIGGQEIPVVTREWSLKDFVREGDDVYVRGVLRENDGQNFISLERSGHIIKPIVR